MKQSNHYKEREVLCVVPGLQHQNVNKYTSKLRTERDLGLRNPECRSPECRSEVAKIDTLELV